MESRSISDVIQNQGTHKAYDYFANSDSVFCQLGMLACQLQTSTISLTEAQNQFEKLKPSASDLNIDELQNLFNMLAYEKKYATYLYNFAHLIDELTRSEDEVSIENLTEDEIKISKKMLGWKDNIRNRTGFHHTPRLFIVVVYRTWIISVLVLTVNFFNTFMAYKKNQPIWL